MQFKGATQFGARDRQKVERPGGVEGSVIRSGIDSHHCPAH